MRNHIVRGPAGAVSRRFASVC